MKKRRYMARVAVISMMVLLPVSLSGCGQTAEKPAESTSSGDAAQAALEEAAYQEDLANLEELFSDPDEIQTMSESVFAEEVLIVDDAPLSDENVEAGHYSDFVTVGEYKGLPVKQLSDGTPAEEGMTVRLTYTAAIDGTIVEDYSDYEIAVTLGSGDSYIEGFEEGVIGHKIGETFTIPITFSEDTEGDYMDPEGEFHPVAGATFDYEVTLAAGWRITPEDALQELTETGSQMISYPKNLMEEARALVESTYAGFADEDDMDAETFIREVLGMTDEEMEDTVYHDAKSMAVIRAILEKEGITEDGEEMSEAVSQYIEDMGYASRDEAFTYGETEESLRNQAEYYAALEILKKYAA